MDMPTMRSRQKGVSLIEVLVAMFLLGIAVIGFVALQVRAMSTTSESLYRSQAIAVAQDLAERMRSNYGQIAAYKAKDWTVMPTQNCYASACSAVQMVDFDVRLAKEAAAVSLPNGSIATRACGGSRNVCIYVAWGDTTTGNTGGANACTNSDSTYVAGTPECVMLEVYNES